MAQSAVTKCPVCKKPATEKYRPFCSKRCADIDLGSWLGERYRVETSESPDQPASSEDTDIE